jgi:formate hydrogenlyase subunit 3/multisubunit Na+/H+ antiporter MnhD subunit
VLAVSAQDLTFEAMRQASLPMVGASLAFSLGLFGFGMKAGLVPVHIWLPEAHPVAPSHISALMSGVMLKIAIYGLMRLTLDLLGTPHWSWGVILLLIGAVSALFGILYALLQNDLKRLLAYSSIENVGIICMGLGLGLLFLAQDQPFLGALGITAALYHALNHAVFKGLLFLSAGAILHTTQERNLEQLGGLIRYMPYTSVFVLVGCLAISALPPFNGFVSEWLIFQTALQSPLLESGVLRATIPFSAALLALTSAFSATCFVKLYGITFLGQPRTVYKNVHEVGLGMRIAQGILALLCLLLGVLPTTLISMIENIPHQLIGIDLPSISEKGWLWLTPISAQIASYSAPLVLLSILAVWGIVYLVLHSTRQTRRTNTWDCGFGLLNSRMQYTATAFAMPLRRIFKPVWRMEERIDETKDERTLYRTTVRYQLQIGDRFWPVLYVPLGHLTAVTAHYLGRIQTGNIRTYLAYSFFTLILLLWLIT